MASTPIPVDGSILQVPLNGRLENQHKLIGHSETEQIRLKRIKVRDEPFGFDADAFGGLKKLSVFEPLDQGLRIATSATAQHHFGLVFHRHVLLLHGGGRSSSCNMRQIDDIGYWFYTIGLK